VENLFLYILMGFGAVLVWKRLTGKVSGASSMEEGFGALVFLFIAGAILFMFLLGALREIFPAVKDDLLLALIVLLTSGSIYLWAFFRFVDWVIGGKHSRRNDDK